MAKLASCLVLLVAVVLCTKGQSNRRKNDPRCHRDGMFANPNDCTAYYKCRNGESQDLNCPDDFKFDSGKHCTPDEDADCGNVRANRRVTCPEDFGMFPVSDNCHKYMVCKEGTATVYSCSENHVYSDVNGGCVPGNTCS